MSDTDSSSGDDLNESCDGSTSDSSSDNSSSSSDHSHTEHDSTDESESDESDSGMNTYSHKSNIQYQSLVIIK